MKIMSRASAAGSPLTTCRSLTTTRLSAADTFPAFLSNRGPACSVAALLFPADIVLLVARLLGVRDRRALLLTCKAYSYVVSPILYRSLNAFFPFPERDSPKYQDPCSYRLLVCLVRSMGRVGRQIRPRCNPQFMVTFAYCSDSFQADLRALPLLGDILRATSRLRHFAIDISMDSVALALDIFRRTGVIITPTAPELDVGRPLPDRLILPRLESICSTRLAVVEALMRYRSVNTIYLEISPNDVALAKFLRPIPAWNPAHIRRLSLSYLGYYCYDTLIGTIFTSFPSLEHFAFRVGTREASVAMLVRSFLLMIQNVFTKCIHSYSCAY